MDRIYQEGPLGVVRNGNYRLGLGVPDFRFAIPGTQHTHSIDGVGPGCMEAERSPPKLNNWRFNVRGAGDRPYLAR